MSLGARAVQLKYRIMRKECSELLRNKRRMAKEIEIRELEGLQARNKLQKFFKKCEYPRDWNCEDGRTLNTFSRVLCTYVLKPSHKEIKQNITYQQNSIKKS